MRRVTIRPFHGRFKLILIHGTAYLGVALTLRLLLWRAFGSPRCVPIAYLPIALGAGAINDLRELLYLLAPLCLYLLLLPQKLACHPAQQKIIAFGSFLFFFSLLLLSVAEYFFFENFSVCFDPALTGPTCDIHLILADFRANFPVGRFILAALFLSLLLSRWLWPIMRESLEEACPLGKKVRALVLYALLLALVFSWHPTASLFWSNNRLATELSTSGLSRIIRALRADERPEFSHDFGLGFNFSNTGLADV